MSHVVDFQKKNSIASNRILVGEFGGNRFSTGLDQYFADLIDIFNENQWHFAFYAFREDTWSGMDYELGITRLGHNAEDVSDLRQKDNTLFSVLKNALI